MPTPVLPARYTPMVTPRYIVTKNKPKNDNGLDMFDKALIGAVKFGFLCMFGLFVAAQAEKRRPGILNVILPPTPAAPKPKLP